MQWLHDNLNGWWRREDDWWLLLGMRLHGLYEFDKIQTDTRLPFAARLGTQETLSFDNTSSDEYKKLQERLATLRDMPGALKLQVDTVAEQLAKKASREQTVSITWPDTDTLITYAKKLISAAKKVLKKAAIKRNKEMERKKREDEYEAREKKQREEERRKVEEEAKAEEERRRRKKEKKTAKLKAKQSEQDDQQRLKQDKSKADKSLEQMLVKRQDRQQGAHPHSRGRHCEWGG